MGFLRGTIDLDKEQIKATNPTDPYQIQAGNSVYDTALYDTQKAEYEASIQQYAGTAIYDQLKNNPYMAFQPYNEGNIWRSMIGDKSGYNDFYNGRYTQALEYRDKLVDALRQQDYNSPASAAARESAAGLNTDLTGVGTGEQPAADGSPAPVGPPSPQSKPEGTFDQVVSTFASVGQNFLSGVLGLYKGFMDLGLASNTLGSAELALTKDAEEYVLNLEAGRASEGAFQRGMSVGDLTDSILSGELLSPSYKEGAYRAPSNIRNRSARRAIERAGGAILYDRNGNPTPRFRMKATEMLAQLTGHEKEAVQNMSMPGYHYNDLMSYCADYGKKFADWQDAIMKFQPAILETQYMLAKAQADRTRAEIPGVEAESNYKSDLYSSTDENGNTLGKSDAITRFHENRRRQLEDQWKSLQRELWFDARKWILDRKNDKFGKIGVMLLPGLEYEFNGPLLENGMKAIGSIFGSIGSIAKML